MMLECQWTVKDLFEKAKYPDSIFIGICWQCDVEEDRDLFVEKVRPTQGIFHFSDNTNCSSTFF